MGAARSQRRFQQSILIVVPAMYLISEFLALIASLPNLDAPTGRPSLSHGELPSPTRRRFARWSFYSCLLARTTSSTFLVAVQICLLLSPRSPCTGQSPHLVLAALRHGPADLLALCARLDQSRAQRILWLLEELELPYEVKTYYRNKKDMLAPPELREVHPLGKVCSLPNAPLLCPSYY